MSALAAAPRSSRWVESAITWLRARIWGAVFALASDGLTTVYPDGSARALFLRNRLPEGPLIVVADHHSHADSAALVAALGRDHRPVVFAAGADYWTSTRARELAGSALIGLWLVRRGPGGRADLLAAADTVREGTVMVVYPSGTREGGDFKTGAFTLAQEAGAAVLPVAVRGTRELLPKGGGYHRGPVEIRLGSVLNAAEVAEGDPSSLASRCQRDIEELSAPPLASHPGWGFQRAARIAASWLGLLVVFLWAFGEGVSWPLVAEMPLLLLVVTCGLSWRAPLLIATSALASILGILTTWWLVTHGFHPPTPLTTERMVQTALAHVADNPATAFWYQMFNGIPVKVYANAAGELGLPLPVLLETVFPRALRIVLVGGVAWALASLLARWLRPCLGAIQVYCLALFPFALALVVGYWS